MPRSRLRLPRSTGVSACFADSIGAAEIDVEIEIRSRSRPIRLHGPVFAGAHRLLALAGRAAQIEIGALPRWTLHVLGVDLQRSTAAVASVLLLAPRSSRVGQSALASALRRRSPPPMSVRSARPPQLPPPGLLALGRVAAAAVTHCPIDRVAERHGLSQSGPAPVGI
jgi:hypothetical protein